MKKVLILLLLFCLVGCSAKMPSNSAGIKDYDLMASEYYASVGELYFEEDSVVPVDALIPFFEVFGMRNEDGELKEQLRKYKTGGGNFKTLIPKELVNNYLKSKFKVTLDDTNSKYYPFGRTDVYSLDAEVRDGFYTHCTKTNADGNVVILDCEGGYTDYYEEDGKDCVEDVVTSKFQLGIEVKSSNECRYIYCKKIQFSDKRTDSAGDDRSADLMSDLLNNKRPFTDESGNSVYLKDYKVKANIDVRIIPRKYAQVDFDNDGTDESVLYASPDYGLYLVFHIVGKNVYGFEFGEREIISLKGDGTFIVSGGAGINCWSGLEFSGTTCRIREEVYKNDIDGEYRLYGKSATAEDVNDYVSEFKKKTDAVWTVIG